MVENTEMSSSGSEPVAREVRLYDWLNQFPSNYHIQSHHIAHFVRKYYGTHDCEKEACLRDYEVLMSREPERRLSLKQDSMRSMWDRLVEYSVPWPPELN